MAYDPVWNGKLFTSGVSRNLTTVLEPNPAGGTLTTSYTYDWMNHLVGSSMTRGSTTQARTFVYNNVGQLTSATNPESGTVAYTYNTDTTLNTKQDAKGQVTLYTYDPLKRTTETQIYPYGLSYSEDVCQRVTYVYDAGTNGTGHLTSTQYGALQPASPMAYIYSGACGTASPYAFQELYTYDPVGAITGKTLAVTANIPGWYESNTQSLNIGYTYDSAGRLSTATYPQTSTYGSSAPTYTYGYDGMGRPVSMTDNLVNSYTGTDNVWVQNGQYDPAGHVTSLGLLSSGSSLPAYTTQTMAYNHNGQVTAMNWATGWGSSGLAYTYSGTQNNGQITQMTDISGETVSYAYDALKRLTGATAVYGGSTMWTQAFGYDGFGNMTSKTLNGGANLAPAIDATTNRLTSGYDANGNMLTGFGLTITYDERNRMASASQMGGTEYYGYAPDNKRIYRWNATTGAEEFTFYGAQGERLGTFTWATTGSPQLGLVPTETNIWFGKKLINRWVVYGGGGPQVVMRDRVGTDRETGASYYPYGDEISSTANDAEKYATYVRDSFTTLDYADQRYYASSYGRFNTPDPYAKSARLRNPGSWNRYAYVAGDPVNRVDPTGQEFMGAQDCMANPEQCQSDDGGGWGFGGPIFSSGPTPIFNTGNDFSGPKACLTNPTFALEHPSWCGGTSSQPSTPPASQPTCDVSLYSQNVFGTPFLHTYIQVSETSGSSTTTQDFEAVPSSNIPPVLQNAGDKPGGGSIYSNNPASLLFDLGVNSTCPEAYSIESLAASFNANTSFLYFLPYNSNSFTYSLLTDSGTPIPSIVNSYLNAPVVFAPGILGTIGIGISWQQAPGWGLLIPPWAGN